MAEYFPIRFDESYAILAKDGTPVLVEKNPESLGCTFAHFYTSRRIGESLPLSFDTSAKQASYSGLVYVVSRLLPNERERFLCGIHKASAFRRSFT